MLGSVITASLSAKALPLFNGSDQFFVEVQSQVDSLEWNKPLPFDKDVIVGKLENGFQYYIRKNTEPENRVTMYLAVKVGSILETESQLGLAHFLEHMNFNGLKHFPKNELVDYLQRAGVRFGSDLNAYTGFDQTVYQLPIPSDDPELLKNGLQVMRDWAQDALLDGEEIDKERGVIMEEMRGGRGSQQRMRDKFLPMLLNNSRYANRLPIGTEEVITTFDHSEIRKFHADWYRPDLMSIIIVGDVDTDHMQNEVKRLFSDMRVPTEPIERKEYKVDLINKNQFMVVTDPEMTYTVGQVLIKHPEEKVKTIKDYRRSLLKSSINQMISERFSEISRSANSPFIQAGAGIEGFMGGLDNMSLFFAAKPGEFETGFKALVREMERIQKFGFTESEFSRTISSMNKSNETAYTERDKKKSDSYVNTYLNHFLEDSPALGNEDRYNLVKSILPTLTLKEAEEIFLQFYQDTNRDIIILAPEKDKESLPEEASVLAWLDEVNKEELTGYVDKVSDLPLLAGTPTPGKVVKELAHEALEMKELILDNGVKVYLKPTTFKNDEILISAFSEGGTSLYDDADYFSASNAGNLVNGSGLGQLTSVEIQKYLTGKRVNIAPYISERSEGLSGYSDAESLETAFEMIYGYFTEPMLEDDIFKSSISSALSSMENREDDPGFIFNKEILESLYGNSVRRTPPSKENVLQIDKDRAFEIFKDRFADASDFSFVFVGSFNEEDIKPYIEKYIASLPALNRNEKAKDLGLYEPSKGFEKVVHKGKEDKANVRMTYYDDYDYSETENVNVQALSSILSIKLTEKLREEESGVYGVGARASYSKEPRGRIAVNIGFGTGVEKVEPLIKVAIEEVDKIKNEGPTQVDIDKFKIEEARQLEVQMKENRFWLSQISSSLQNDRDPAYIFRYLEDVNAVTKESIQKVAQKYLKEDKLFKFILLPDEK